jgi:hypothetical protein
VQVHGDSLLYPVLFGGAFVTLALFGIALWYFATRGKTDSPAPEAGGRAPSDPALNARILREMEDIE